MPTPKLSRKKHAKIHELAADGLSMRKVARMAKVGFGTAVNYCKIPLPGSDSGAGAKLPESWAEEYKPFLLDGVKRVLILCDIHIPFQINRAVEAAVNYGHENAVDCVLLNGDVFDFHVISKYPHDGTKLTYQQEVDYGRQFLAYLRGQFPKARIVFKEGNHDERLEKYILAKAEALFGLLTLPELFRFAQLGIEHVGEQRVVRLGKLRVIHGHEYGGGVSAPVNAARWLLNKSRKSSVMGHLHQTSEQPETDIDGEVRAAWSVGCLSSLNPKYRRLAQNWNHGCAVVHMGQGGDFEMFNRRIRDGQVK